MTSATSMIMEQAVMPMDTTKYNHKHHPFIKHIGLHTSGQDIDSLYFCKISASILLEQDMTYSSEVHDKGDPFSTLLE